MGGKGQHLRITAWGIPSLHWAMGPRLQPSHGPWTLNPGSKNLKVTPTCTRDLAGDGPVDAVEDAGHADEHGGLELADVVHQLGGVALGYQGWMENRGRDGAIWCLPRAVQGRQRLSAREAAALFVQPPRLACAVRVWTGVEAPTGRQGPFLLLW